MTLQEVLLEIWRQALVEGAAQFEVDGRKLRVTATSKSRLKQVDFSFEDRSLRGIEQNPDTASRWAAMARRGAKIMQFTEVEPGQMRGRFFANVSDGKVNWYHSAGKRPNREQG
ncbi:MAG TPA: hypothetical protein VEG63_14250 [Candidatus Acidoferrales bacterium]|nr:hypothetical protein [Candidatus Acidoferrales bacterium]